MSSLASPSRAGAESNKFHCYKKFDSGWRLKWQLALQYFQPRSNLGCTSLQAFQRSLTQSRSFQRLHSSTFPPPHSPLLLLHSLSLPPERGERKHPAYTTEVLYLEQIMNPLELLFIVELMSRSMAVKQEVYKEPLLWQLFSGVAFKVIKSSCNKLIFSI